MAHAASIVVSVSVDASISLLLTPGKCVALLAHTLGIVLGILMRTLVNLSLLSTSIRLVVYLVGLLTFRFLLIQVDFKLFVLWINFICVLSPVFDVLILGG